VSVTTTGRARFSTLVVSVAALAAPACQVVQPISPRTVTAGSTTLGLDHLRDDSVAVSVRGAPVRAGWLVDGPPSGAACKSGVGSIAVGAEIHRVSPPAGTSLVELRFPAGALFAHLTRPSSLALELDDGSCPVLPLAGTDPALAYRLGSGAIWNAGAMVSGFVPLAGTNEIRTNEIGYGVFEWDPFRVGRWIGPVIPTVAIGFSLTSRVNSLHAAALLMGYPLVFRRLAIGIGAGYEVRPSWAPKNFADGDGFKWIHGPRVELHIVAVPEALLGFPPPVKMRKIGVSVWASRLDADRFSATILGVGLVQE
jgi:hypothetical protein